MVAAALAAPPAPTAGAAGAEPLPGTAVAVGVAAAVAFALAAFAQGVAAAVWSSSVHAAVSHIAVPVASAATQCPPCAQTHQPLMVGHNVGVALAGCPVA